jgi:hypothetical protein
MQALMLLAGTGTLLPGFRQRLATAFPAARFSKMAGDDEFLLAFAPDSRMYVEYYGTDLTNWEGTELTYIKSVLPVAQHVYSLAYRGLEAAKKVVVQLADSQHVLVDNDNGTLLRGDDFVRKVLAEPTWYWFDDLGS